MAPTPDQHHSRKRPWLAAALSILVPGLGHLYLRLWGRALLWLGLSILATFIVFPESALPESFSLEAIFGASEALSLEASVLILGVSILCMIDAYLMGQRINYLVNRSERIAAGASPTRCPNCGKELDPDIEFCHWCTTEIKTPEENET